MSATITFETRYPDMLKRLQPMAKQTYSKALSGASQYQVVMPMIMAITSVITHIMALTQPSLASSIGLVSSKKVLGHFHGVKLLSLNQKTTRDSAWLM